ncbi:MAG: efflux RND transporter periplasmic adaptor subunit [Planctomycetota bacterium]|jgi:multidrug efflux pump subunit AcrA (membrane-fusion protein)
MAKKLAFLSGTVRIVLAALILAGGAAGSYLLSQQKEPPTREPEDRKPPLVETAQVTRHEGGLEIEVDGVVVPYREITLSAEVEGRVVKKADECRAGRFVRKDSLLFRIDPQDYQLEIRRLTEGLDPSDYVPAPVGQPSVSAQSLLGLAEKDLGLQQVELARLLKLGGSRVAAETAITQGERGVIAAQNALLTLRSQLEKALLNLSRTEIKSPVDGVVVDDPVEQSDFVRRGMPLVTIEDTSKVEVKCNLRMDELYWLWNQSSAEGVQPDQVPAAAYHVPKTPVTVVYRLAGVDYEWTGELSRYDGIGLDETTRTVPCRITVDTPRNRRIRVVRPDAPVDSSIGPPALLRGMYVTVRVHAEPRAALVEIPESAVRPGKRVWRVAGGELRILDVDVIRVTDRRAIIRAGGLRAGDRVVVTPLPAAQDGMTVRERSES